MCCFCLLTNVFAANQHQHPQAAKSADAQSAGKSAMMPAYCEIEIVNDSYDNVHVFGVFDDGTSLPPFNIHINESAHYISLYYYGYCHAGMSLYVDTFNGFHVYSGYTPANTTIHVLPYFGNMVKAEVRAK